MLVAKARQDVLVWDPNPDLGNVRRGRASVYRWKDRKGVSWSGLLILPADFDSKHRYPLLIQTHGFSGEKFFADGEYPSGSPGRAIAAKNVLVLQMDMHLSHIATPQEGRDQDDGFLSAIASLTERGLIDEHRVGIIGFSRTSYHVLYALVQLPGKFAAALIVDYDFSYGPYLMASTGGKVNAFQENAEAMNGGIPIGRNLLQWFKVVPDFNLDRVRVPIIITAMERGALVGQWEMFSMLRRLDKPVELLWLANQYAPHILVQPAHRWESQQTAVEWFDFWLNGHEDTNPRKNDQYRRWEKLCSMQVEQNPHQPAFCVRSATH
jgi:hypothetical protein